MDWYDLCKKYKVLDWIDDHIIWYIWDTPKSWFKTIRYWFYCNWNMEHWRLVKSAIVSYPWDYYFMNKTMECYIDQQLRWFNKHHEIEGWQEDVVRPMMWAKHCIHTINNEHELSDYDYETHTHKYIGPRVNYRNVMRYIKIQNDFAKTCKVEEILDFYQSYPEEYYKLKCEYIFHKILLQYCGGWWD